MATTSYWLSFKVAIATSAAKGSRIHSQAACAALSLFRAGFNLSRQTDSGDPGGTPTPDLGFRKALLYAAELRGHGGDLASWGDLKKGAAPSMAKKSGVGGGDGLERACG